MSNLEDFFTGGGSAFTFWPEQNQTRPSIQVGTDSIYFVSVGVLAQPDPFLSSYTSAGALEWSVSRNDISGSQNMLALAFDSIAELAYVASTGSAADDTLYLSSVNLVDGVVTNIGNFTLTGVANAPGEFAIGRVDNANGRVHWLGIRDANDDLYVVQDTSTGAEVSTDAIVGGGSAEGIPGNVVPIYINTDFTKALYYNSNNYADGDSSDARAHYNLGVIDLTNFKASGFVTVPVGGNGHLSSVPLLAYGADVVGSNDSNLGSNRFDSAKYLDADLNSALNDLADRLGI